MISTCSVLVLLALTLSSMAAPQVGQADCPPGAGELTCCINADQPELIPPGYDWDGTWDGAVVKCKAYPSENW